MGGNEENDETSTSGVDALLHDLPRGRNPTVAGPEGDRLRLFPENEDVALRNPVAGETREAILNEPPCDAPPALRRRDGEVMQVAVACQSASTRG
jgi:hypothetical protein